MLTAYAHEDGRLVVADFDRERDPVWVDLFEPTDAEREAVSQRLGIAVPTLEDMQEIELSARFYQDGDARTLTVVALFGLDRDTPTRTPFTFILRDDVLVTVRHVELKSVAGFTMRAIRSKAGPCERGEEVATSLLESLVDRLADALERVGAGIDEVSHDVFRRRIGREKAKGRDLEALIGKIGRTGEVIDIVQESMVSIGRAAGYLDSTRDETRPGSVESRHRAEAIRRDADGLGEHANFLSEKINFLLDAALGLISLEQNKVMKLFSIVSVVFMPPTLVASIYGMNFRLMPELDWTLGYPMALATMLFVAVVPLAFFKLKGWL